MLLPLLLVNSADQMWLVYLVVAVEAALGTVVEPCRNATAATLSPVGGLMSVNQVMGVLSNVARLIGGPLGGLVLGFYGITGVLLVDVTTFAFAAALLYVGRRPRVERVTPDNGAPGFLAAVTRLGRDWADGLTIIRQSSGLRRILAVSVFISLAQGAFIVLFVLFVIRDLNRDEADVGLLRGVQAIGAIVGVVPLSFATRKWRPNQLLTVSLVTFGLLSLITWDMPLITTAFIVYVILFIAAGIPGIAGATSHLTLLQTYSMPQARGRIISTFLAFSNGVQAVGMLLAGLVGTGHGLTIALQVQAAMYLVAAGLAVRLAAIGMGSVTKSPGPAGRADEQGAVREDPAVR
jgi:Na+/melibiose symporter-like transporter